MAGVVGRQVMLQRPQLTRFAGEGGAMLATGPPWGKMALVCMFQYDRLTSDHWLVINFRIIAVTCLKVVFRFGFSVSIYISEHNFFQQSSLPIKSVNYAKNEMIYQTHHPGKHLADVWDYPSTSLHLVIKSRPYAIHS